MTVQSNSSITSQIAQNTPDDANQAPLCVLAFSGGLDTTFCGLHLRELGYRVVTVAVNTGGFDLLERERISTLSNTLGSEQHFDIDARADLWQNYLRFLVYGNVLRGNLYPLSVSAERVCQAKSVAEVALKLGAHAICHGSTGAGNDQIRFDVAFRTLVPGIKIVAPIRELGLSREYELNYLAEKGIAVPTRASSYSVNEGMWGCSVGGKETHDSWQHLPEASYPGGEIDPLLAACTLELEFAQGQPVSLNGQPMDPIALIAELNAVGQRYGIGRGIHLGDTILGIKGRVGFEAAAATLLIQAHRELEKLVLSGKQLHYKEALGNTYGSLLHEGHYFDPLARDLECFLTSSQQRVSGGVRLKLRPYSSFVEGIRSPYSLMQSKIASYGEGAKAWSGAEAAGFAKIFGISQQLSHSQASTL